MTAQKLFQLFVVATGCVLSACGGDKTTGGKTAPSSVENAVPESALTTVTLTPEAEKRLGIEIATLEMRDVQKMRVYAGMVTPAPGASSLVSAPFSGIVAAPEEGLPTPGAPVAYGASILMLRGIATQSAGVSPDEELRVKKLELDNARARLRRTSALVAANGASEEEREQARADMARAQAAFNSLNMQLNGSDDASGSDGVPIRAPLSGTLGEYTVGLGQMVATGDPLFRVTNLNSTTIRVPVFANDAKKIADDAVATVAPLGNSVEGGLSAKRIPGPPTATSGNGSIDLYFEAENSNGQFRPGERIEISIPAGASSGENTERLVTPHSAIFTDIHGGSWVYERMSDGVYARRRVMIDFLVDDIAVLSAGPAPGRIIVSVGVAELAGSEFGVGK